MAEETAAAGAFPTERPLFLHTLALRSSLRILVLAPHPDDFDAIGVTLRWFRDNGNQISVAVLTGAASGVEDSFCSPPTDEHKAAIREQEQRDSCVFFGLPSEGLTFPHLEEDASGSLADSPANATQIHRLLSKHRPDLIFMPHGNDTNTSHQRTCRICREQIAELGHPATLVLNRDPKTIEMRNDLFTLFGAQEAAWKGQLLRCHRSQHQRNLNTRNHGFDNRVLNVNWEIAQTYVKGRQADYAEAFELDPLGRYP